MKSSIDIFPVLLGSRLRISTLNLLPHKMLSTALATFLITFHSCRFPWVNSIIVSNIGGPDRCCVTLENPDLFFFCNSFAVLSPTVAFSTPPISPFNAVFLTENEIIVMSIYMCVFHGQKDGSMLNKSLYYVPKPLRSPCADAIQRTPRSLTVLADNTSVSRPISSHMITSGVWF